LFLCFRAAPQGPQIFCCIDGAIMARYEHLPIYKRSFDLLLWMENVVRNFSRYHKYTLGSDLRNVTRQVLKTIVEANSVQDRRIILERLRIELEELIVLVRIAKEVKAFHNLNSYQYAAGEVINLCRQNEGWLKSLDRKQPESPVGIT
jgi:23S rRNA-intervening sequence protein